MSNDAAVIRGALPGNTAKRLSRLAGISIATANCWLYRQLSASRRRDLALALLAEMDAEDVRRDAIRRRLVEWASGSGGMLDAALDRVGRHAGLAMAGTRPQETKRRDPAET